MYVLPQAAVLKYRAGQKSVLGQLCFRWGLLQCALHISDLWPGGATLQDRHLTGRFFVVVIYGFTKRLTHSEVLSASQNCIFAAQLNFISALLKTLVYNSK